MMAEVRIEREHEALALIRLMAPERRNALTGDMAREMYAALAEIDADDNVGAIVISGGEDAFSAGAHRGCWPPSAPARTRRHAWTSRRST